MKTILVFFINVYIIGNVLSQDFNSEQYKYWYYRDRLKYFVMPGTEPGQSILFSRRNPSIEEQWDGTQYTMDVDQVRKIEELTLYMLELKQENDALRKLIEAQ